MDRLGDFTLNWLNNISVIIKQLKLNINSSNDKVIVKQSLVFRLKLLFIKIVKENPVKVFVYSLFFILFILQNTYNEEFNSHSGEYLFTSFFIYVMIIVLLLNLSIYIIRNKIIGSYFFSAIFTLIFHSYLVYSFCKIFLVEIEKQGQIDFIRVIFTLIPLIVPLIAFIKDFIDINSQSTGFIIVLLSFLVFEASIFMYFGIYNISTGDYAVVQINDLSSVLNIMQIGSQNIFQYPGYDCRIEYFIQYIIGYIYHILIIGFFISYFSSKISQKYT